ncbi:MAG: holo-ACP synthase [Lachnospiraceae bacterium]|nr:holo-ACP synthase [Lachnospiraceae bacterium]
MTKGIGVDILKISNIASSISNPEDSFISHIYTKKELVLINQRPIPLFSYATRFAGKEAIFKSLGVDGNAIRLNELEILEAKNGQPIVLLHGNAKTIADQKGISQILISLSYDTDYAIAYATAIV